MHPPGRMDRDDYPGPGPFVFALERSGKCLKLN